MLSIGKLGAGQHSYYLDKVAEGAEDYYSGEGEAEGPESDPGSHGPPKIQTTFDVYGHLPPGSYDDVRARMDAYLETGRP